MSMTEKELLEFLEANPASFIGLAGGCVSAEINERFISEAINSSLKNRAALQAKNFAAAKARYHGTAQAPQAPRQAQAPQANALDPIIELVKVLKNTKAPDAVIGYLQSPAIVNHPKYAAIMADFYAWRSKYKATQDSLRTLRAMGLQDDDILKVMAELEAEGAI
jgi:SOS response regulatory protein OraA/RecX